MSFTDEQLSAFLDRELPAAAMENIRDTLVESEALSDRLATLAEVDSIIASTYSTIDQQPLPENIQRLVSVCPETPVFGQTLTQHKDVLPFSIAQVLENARKEKSHFFFSTPRNDMDAASGCEPVKNVPVTDSAENNVVAGRQAAEVIPLPVKPGWSQPLALAASVILAIGIGFVAVFSTNAPEQSTTEWNAVARVLSKTPSGHSYQLGKSVITPRLSFQNHQGDYCRVYFQANRDQKQENLACRKNGRWQLDVSVIVSNADTVSDQPGELYQPASDTSALDDVIDQRMAAGPYDADQEQRLIRQGW